MWNKKLKKWGGGGVGGGCIFEGVKCLPPVIKINLYIIYLNCVAPEPVSQFFSCDLITHLSPHHPQLLTSV